MILNNAIIEDVKERSGLLFDKAGDFAILASLIFKATGRSIGVTTLKRLFYYINDDRKASEYTMNTIALYVGYNSWDEYSASKNLDSDWSFPEETLYIHALDVNTRICIQYLNRKVNFVVVEHEGENHLKVESGENSSLKAGDLLFVYRIRKGEILEAERVIRGDMIGNYKTHGEVMNIEVVVSQK